MADVPTNAQEILQQMQKSKRQRVIQNAMQKINPYPYLEVSKFKRIQLTFAVIGALIAGTFLVHIRTLEGDSINDTLVFLFVISSLLVLVPMTEEWFYGPWQAKPQIIERIENE